MMVFYILLDCYSFTRSANYSYRDINMNEISYILGTFLSCIFKDTYSVPMAYLDPGTGAMIISALVGVFATIILGAKTFWYKLLGVFKGTKSSHSTPKKGEEDGIKKTNQSTSDD